MTKILTFDLGTSYFKICLFDGELRLIAQQRVATPVKIDGAGQAELSIEQFQQCLTAGVQAVGSEAGGLHDVAAIGFASQANTFTLLDENFAPLIPFLLWSDERARDYEQRLKSLVDLEDFCQTTGIPKLDRYFLPAKLLWLRDRGPELFARARHLCCIGDYLTWWLTGVRVTEASLTGLTGLMDIHALKYWPVALEFAGVPTSWLPPIARAGETVGPLRAEIAQLLGLPHHCQIVLGCLDQFAGAIGACGFEPDQVCETTGTVLATVRYSNEFDNSAEHGLFQGPAFNPGGYYQMVFSDTSAALLQRYRDQQPDRPSFEELDQLAEQIPPNSEGLRLHPQASRRPVAEMFLDRKPIHGRGHEVRAIMEGVARELHHQVERLCGDAWPRQIRSAGGAARSRVWLEIKSQVLGCPVVAVDCPEPTSLGAARLAMWTHRPTLNTPQQLVKQ